MESRSMLNQAYTGNLHYQQHPPRQLNAYRLQNQLSWLVRFMVWLRTEQLMLSNPQTNHCLKQVTNLMLLLIVIEILSLCTHCCGYQRATLLSSLVIMTTKIFPKDLSLRTTFTLFAACSGVMKCLNQEFVGVQQIHHLASNRSVKI